MKQKVAILGAGNGGCASAVDFTLRGFDVALYNRTLGRIEEIIKQNNCLKYEGVWGEGGCKLPIVSTNIEEILEDADLIMLNVPGPGHEAYAKVIAPYLKEDSILLMNPGHSGGALHMAKTLKELGINFTVKIAETNTLSYISRMKDSNTIHVSSTDKPVMVGVFPNAYKTEVMEHINKFYPKMKSAANVLESTLSNLNAMFHPQGMVLNAGWIEFTKGDFKFYYEGITPAIGRVIDEMDKERIEVGRAFGLELKSFCDTLYEAGSTTKEAAESNSAYKACQESEANKFIQSPATLDHRYMHEDICSGILVFSCLGKVANIPTPITDAHITLASSLMNIDYWTEGVNLERMGIEGMDIDELKQFIEYGSKKQLV